MRNHVYCPALAVSLLMGLAGPTVATDLDAPKLNQKRVHARHHDKARNGLPGPVLAEQVTRAPTCGFSWFPGYPSYAQASCRDYDGFATVYDPRSSSGVGVYPFRVRFGLR